MVGNSVEKVAALLTQTELFNQRTVVIDVLLGEVLEEALALAYHLYQSAVGGEVFLVLLYVGRDMVDTLSEHSYLRFDRAGIGWGGSVGRKQILLCFGSKVRHLSACILSCSVSLIKGCKSIGITGKKKNLFRSLNGKLARKIYSLCQTDAR